jgi:acyl-CoA synthetase (AMP-forming)/AMP-acid ligase II
MPHPWLSHYPESVPHSLHPYPDTTLFDLLAASARKQPEQPAITFKGRTLSRREWDRQSDAFAAALVSQGEVRAYCKARLAPHKVPVRVAFREELPKSQVGKILRRALRAEPSA